MSTLTTSLRLVAGSLGSWQAAPAESLRRRFASGAFWYLTGTISYHGFRLLALVAAARMLGRQSFGELGALQSTILMFALFAGLGLGLTATKHVAQYRYSDPVRAGRIIGTSWLVAALSGGFFSLTLLLAAPWLAASVLGAAHLAPQFRIASGLVLFHALIGAQTGVLAGLEAFQSIARSNLLHGLLSFVIVVAGVYLGGLPGAVAGLVVSAAVGLVVNQWFLRQEFRRAAIRPVYVPTRGEWSMLLHFSLPAVIRGAMNAPVNWIGAAILVNQPHGFAEMGVFSAANQWRLLILMTPSVLERISLPILASLHGQGSMRGHFRAVRTQVLASFCSAACLAIPVSVAAPLLMGFYGESFRSGWPAIPLLAASALLASVNNAVAIAFMSTGAVWLTLRFDALWALCLISLALVLAPAGGALGLAATYPAACLVQGLVLLFYWKRRAVCGEDTLR